VAAGFVGTVLLLAGLAKLAGADWRAAAGMRASQGFQEVLAGLPVAEIICGALVIAGFRWAGVAAAILLAGFTAFLAWRLRRHEATPCGCFGEVSARPVSSLSIGRNLLLWGAAVVVAGGWDLGRQGDSLVIGRLAGAAVGVVLVAAERTVAVGGGSGAKR
jgi:uncharacterized membrane protein YphA (DoxX/SURF4 family)